MRKAMGFSLGILVSVASATVACNSPREGVEREVQPLAPLDMEVMVDAYHEDESVQDRWVQLCNLWNIEAESDKLYVLSRRVVNSAGYTSGDKVLNAPTLSYEVFLMERGSCRVVKELPLVYMPDIKLNLNGTTISWCFIRKVYGEEGVEKEFYVSSYDYESGERTSERFGMKKKEEKPSRIHSWMGPHQW